MRRLQVNNRIWLPAAFAKPSPGMRLDAAMASKISMTDHGVMIAATKRYGSPQQIEGECSRPKLRFSADPIDCVMGGQRLQIRPAPNRGTSVGVGRQIPREQRTLRPSLIATLKYPNYP